jgi:hypothetical protein
MWSGFISIRPTRQWCFASMRRARSRPSNAPSPCFQWGSATSKASPTTTSATAQPRCSPPSTCLTRRGHRPMQPRHRHQEFLALLRPIEANVPAQLDVYGRRQLRHPQASQGQSLARTPSALAHSLHAHLCLLAQPGRTLLRPHHSTRHPSRLFRFHRGPRQKNRPLHPHPQCKFLPIRVDCDR